MYTNNPMRFRKYVKNDAPRNLRRLFFIDLAVCIVCLAFSAGLSLMGGYYGLADTIAMALTVLVMFLVKSRACAVILLVYSVLASVYGLILDGSFSCFPMIIAGILSTVVFLTLNKAYENFKSTSMEVI